MGNPPGWDAIHNYKFPTSRAARVTFFWASNCKSDPCADLVLKARTIMKQHNLDLNVFRQPGRSSEMELPFQEQVYLDDQAEELRQKAAQKFDVKTQGANGDKRARLPVIFCPFRDGYGESTGGVTLTKTNWPSYVLINSENVAPDKVTLLHEMLHAAGAVHQNLEGNVMSYSLNRNDFLRNDVIKLANAYFSVD
jgi:hypothetical protein